MKICFLNAPGCLGGAERSLLDLACGLKARRSGFEVRLTVGQDGPLMAEAARRDLECELVPMPEALAQAGSTDLGGRKRLGDGIRLATRFLGLMPEARAYANRLRQHLEACQPDIVHSNSIKTHLLTPWAIPVSAKVVWHVRDFLGRRGALASALRWAARGGVTAVANSQATAQDTRLALGIPVRPILNAVDLNRFSPGPGDGAWIDKLAGMAPAAQGTVRVGILATYARWKGQDLFLRAAARLARQAEPFLRFYVIGGPVYSTAGSQFSRDELGALAHELGISQSVGFVDFQLEPPPIYLALDLVVHASTAPEPFGLTIAEAMACGRPVVVAKAGGAAELFTDGYDAIGYEPGKADDLAEAIRQLAGDDSKRSELGARARQSALKRFSLERLVNEMLNLYQSLA